MRARKPSPYFVCAVGFFDWYSAYSILSTRVSSPSTSDLVFSINRVTFPWRVH